MSLLRIFTKPRNRTLYLFINLCHFLFSSSRSLPISLPHWLSSSLFSSPSRFVGNWIYSRYIPDNQTKRTPGACNRIRWLEDMLLSKKSHDKHLFFWWESYPLAISLCYKHLESSLGCLGYICSPFNTYVIFLCISSGHCQGMVWWWGNTSGRKGVLMFLYCWVFYENVCFKV